MAKPCTSYLHPKTQLACKTRSCPVEFSWSADMILLLMYTFLIATNVVHQTDKLHVLQIHWHVAHWYYYKLHGQKCSPWCNWDVLGCFSQKQHKIVVRIFINKQKIDIKQHINILIAETNSTINFHVPINPKNNLTIWSITCVATKRLC